MERHENIELKMTPDMQKSLSEMMYSKLVESGLGTGSLSYFKPLNDHSQREFFEGIGCAMFNEMVMRGIVQHSAHVLRNQLSAKARTKHADVWLQQGRIPSKIRLYRGA